MKSTVKRNPQLSCIQSALRAARPSLTLCIAAWLLLTPLGVFAASVEITELMYDPPGANAAHQWVEVTNIGAEAVDLSGWRLAEGGTNHLLTVVAGTSTLPAGASLLIANNTQNFLDVFPQYAGALIKSSFTLLAKGDTVALKDKKLNTVDSVTYAPSAGAAGDGNTLHRVSSTLVVGAPDPGAFGTPPAPIVKTATVSTSAKSVASVASASKIPAAQTAAAAQAPLLDSLAVPPAPTGWNLLLAVLLGCAALVSLTLGALLYWRALPKTASETKTLADEFEIQ